MRSETEKMFYQEVREKKRAGSNIFKRASTRRGGAGKVFMTADLLRGKEKRAYQKGGKVFVSYEILPRAKFDELSDEEQKKRIIYWRDKFAVKDITDGLGCSRNKFYSYLDKLEIPKRNMKNRKDKGQKKKPRTNQEPAPKPEPAMNVTALPEREHMAIAPEEPTETQKNKQSEKEEQILILNGLNIAYNGKYKADQIRKILTKIDILLDDEHDEFTIELKLMQDIRSDDG